MSNTEAAAFTWPEQDAVDAWIDAHGLRTELELGDIGKLKDAVTEPRRKVQKELAKLKEDYVFIEAYDKWLRRNTWIGVAVAFAAGAGVMWALT